MLKHFHTNLVRIFFNLKIWKNIIPILCCSSPWLEMDNGIEDVARFVK